MFRGETQIAARTDALRQVVLDRAETTDALLRKLEDRVFAGDHRLRDAIAEMEGRLAAVEGRLADLGGHVAKSLDQAAARDDQRAASLSDRLDAVQKALEPDAWMADRTTGRRFPTFRGADGRMLVTPDYNAVSVGRAPVVVLSIPKAGTYLVGLLLEKLGYKNTDLHVAQTSLTDYRQLSITEKRGKAYLDRTYFIPIGASAALVGDGQFMVGHLHSEPFAHAALQGFRKLFLYRNLVDATFSHMRFLVDADRIPDGATWFDLEPGPAQALIFLRETGRELFEGSYRPLLGWLQQPDVFAMPFELFVENSGDDDGWRSNRLAELRKFLNVQDDIEAILAQKVLGQPTKTLSSGRTQSDIYMDDEVRQALRDLGINEMHQLLGYPLV